MSVKKRDIIKGVALLAATYVFAQFQGGFTSGFLFYSCISLACYELAAYFLTFATLEVSRSVDRTRLQDGEDVVVTLRFKRKIWFPLGWNMVIEPLPERLAGLYEPHRQVLFPWFKREAVIRYVIPNVPRGYYQLGDCIVTGGDSFGFFRRSKSFPLHNSFLVYPSHQVFTHWSTGDGRNNGTIRASRQRSNDVAAVRGVRDYQRGDRLSQIHWRASARGLGLKTKEFEHLANNQVMLFLNTSREDYAVKDPELFETAVKLTASLVYYLSRKQDPFGLAVYQRERSVIPIGSSQAHFFRVFDQLARVHLESGQPFSAFVSKEAMELPAGLTIAVITPSLDVPLITALNRLTRSGRTLHVFYVHDLPALNQDELKALQMLKAGNVTVTPVSLSAYETLKRIGGG